MDFHWEWSISFFICIRASLNGFFLIAPRTRFLIWNFMLNSAFQKNAVCINMAKNDLFAGVIAFQYLLPKQGFLKFKRVLTAQIDNFLKSTTHISEEELLCAMGFPANWKKISLYRIWLCTAAMPPQNQMGSVSCSSGASPSSGVSVGISKSPLSSV